MYLAGSTWRTVHAGSCSALACSPVPDVRRPIAPGAQVAMHSTYGTGALTKTITYKHIRYQTRPDCQGLLQSSCLLSSHKQPSEVSAEPRGFVCFWIDAGGVPLASIKLHSETMGKKSGPCLNLFCYCYSLANTPRINQSSLYTLRSQSCNQAKIQIATILLFHTSPCCPRIAV